MSTADHIFCIRQILEKKWEHNEAVHRLFIDFKKAYYSVRREALYNILIEFGIPKKLARLIKICLSEMYSRVWVDKICLKFFQLRMVYNMEMLCRHYFSTLLCSMPLRGFR
jgi:hypothetical protein